MSSRAEKVRIRATSIVSIIEINVRCFTSGWALTVFILATRAIGVSQALKISRGVASGSAAKAKDILCQSL